MVAVLLIKRVLKDVWYFILRQVHCRFRALGSLPPGSGRQRTKTRQWVVQAAHAVHTVHAVQAIQAAPFTQGNGCMVFPSTLLFLTTSP